MNDAELKTHPDSSESSRHRPKALLILFAVCLGLVAGRCDTLTACKLDMNEFEILSAGYSKLFGVDDIETPELFAWREQKDRPLLLIDVRRPQEQSVSHLPGAILARTDEDLGALPAVREFRAQHAQNSRARIVVYCAAGYRSGRSISNMSGDDDASGPAVINLRGGIIGYANAGGPLVTPAGEATRKVHGYNEKWSSYLKAPAEAVLEPPIPDA
ncbi:MAG: rhodanese-like domain-containing protein [bacterium]|nr:rhodanese-like domain-containing protein [bacterium]